MVRNRIDLVVQHMEPDHAANIENFMNAYPDTTIVANTKTFGMMKNFFRNLDLEGRTLEVGNGESLTLGRHVLTFVFAPMVHWPVSYGNLRQHRQSSVFC